MSFLDQHLLSSLILLPVAAAIVVALLPRESVGLHKLRLVTALGSSLGPSSWSRWTCWAASSPRPRCSSSRTVPWLPAYGIAYRLGIDGISLWLVILTTFLTPLCLLGSWQGIEHRQKEFGVFMLLLEAGMIGVFCALDLFLFYIFWEAMLIPMYFLIGIWGHDRRIYAAVKFFLYTMAGTVLMLVAILVLYRRVGACAPSIS